MGGIQSWVTLETVCFRVAEKSTVHVLILTQCSQEVKTRSIPMIIRCLGIPMLTSSWITDPKVLHMASMDSRCSGQSREILVRSNQTVDRDPLMGVYGLRETKIWVIDQLCTREAYRHFYVTEWSVMSVNLPCWSCGVNNSDVAKGQIWRHNISNPGSQSLASVPYRWPQQKSKLGGDAK